MDAAMPIPDVSISIVMMMAMIWFRFIGKSAYAVLWLKDSASEKQEEDGVFWGSPCNELCVVARRDRVFRPASQVACPDREANQSE